MNKILIKANYQWHTEGISFKTKSILEIFTITNTQKKSENKEKFITIFNRIREFKL